MDIDELSDGTVIKYGEYYTHLGLVRTVMSERGIPITEENIEKLLKASVEIEESEKQKNSLIP